VIEPRIVILVAAVVPSLGWAAVVGLLDARRPRPWAKLAAGFVCGAVVAGLVAARVNELVVAEIAATTTTEARAYALAAASVGPLLEELIKAAALLLLSLLRRDMIRNVREGVVLGAAVGLGFELVESLGYLTLAAVQGGSAGLLRGMWLRCVLAGPKHAVFTGTIGAGIGWAREAQSERARVAMPLLAFCAAVLQHVAWNAGASRIITAALCGAPAPGAVCRAVPPDGALFLVVPATVLAFIGPGALVLAIAARRRSAGR